MDFKKVLEEIKVQKLREAELWKKLEPELALEAITKVMKMADTCDIQVLLQYSYYLPKELSEQLYLLGKLYELYHSGYLPEPDLDALLKEIKENLVDKGQNFKSLAIFLLISFLLLN